MPDLFLNAEELAELTGYRHAAKQAAILRQRGIAFFLNGRGKPLVSRTLIENGGKPAKPEPPAAWQPAALRHT